MHMICSGPVCHQGKAKATADDFDSLHAEGEKYLERMDYENAIGVYEKALALRPRHIETLDMLAELCINVDRAEDAHRVWGMAARKGCQVGTADAQMGFQR